jgi:two-component system, LuxR family, response regulator FixJ
VMTGYGDVPTSVRAFRGGAVDFLEKPVKPRVLLGRIRDAWRSTAGSGAQCTSATRWRGASRV